MQAAQRRDAGAISAVSDDHHVGVRAQGQRRPLRVAGLTNQRRSFRSTSREQASTHHPDMTLYL